MSIQYVDRQFKHLFGLSPDYLTNVKLLYVFESGSEVIIVTKDDKVFSFGTNVKGLLGLGNNGNIFFGNNQIYVPKLVDTLCYKQVVDIQSGNEFLLALIKSGKLYSWGNNSWGQLGIGSICPDSYTPTINQKLLDNNVNVCAMSYGYYHSLILTKIGEVYSFGYNSYGQIGCGNNKNQFIPIKISKELFESENVVSIACGAYHSLALTESGEVFSWGYNKNGELGICINNINKSIPTKIESMNNIVIKKICCGYDHSLLLSVDGCIYGFGFNRYGQLGIGSKANQNTPTKIDLSIKFIDIATDLWNNISIGSALNSTCYVWGDCVYGVLTSPKETQYKSIHSTFTMYGKRKVTYKPINFEKEFNKNPILKKFENLFNNSDECDLKLKIDNKFIYTQKWFLKTFCKQFNSIFPNDWFKNETNEIELTQYPYAVYYSFLKYYYTDCVDIDVKESSHLLNLANRLEEVEFKDKCIKIVKSEICEENVCDLYSASVTHSSQELEDKCFEFCLDKLNRICISDNFKRMDENSRTRFIFRTAEAQAFK